MSGLDHPCIVRLIGVCLGPPLILVSVHLSQKLSVDDFSLLIRRSLGIPNNILVPRGRCPFGRHQESRPGSTTGSLRFSDFLSLCACLESSLTNLICSGLILLCLQSQSEPESHWTCLEVVILGADQKECVLLGREFTNIPKSREKLDL